MSRNLRELEYGEAATKINNIIKRIEKLEPNSTDISFETSLEFHLRESKLVICEKSFEDNPIIKKILFIGLLVGFCFGIFYLYLYICNIFV